MRRILCDICGDDVNGVKADKPKWEVKEISCVTRQLDICPACVEELKWHILDMQNKEKSNV